MAAPPRKDELERLMTARREIDRAILDRHAVHTAILFTDIVGSTEYFERNGDIAGLAMIRRHNALLFPVVESHQGRVVKTIGDAIMAVFSDVAQAVRCAGRMQLALEEANNPAAEEDPIHIRIGVHAGRVMVDNEDVFGDAVNTAARIQGRAGADEVMLSASLYDSLPADAGLRATPQGSVELKGKAEPVPIVSLEWRGMAALRDDGEAAEIFVLDLQLGKNGLKVAVMDGAADKGAVRNYQEMPVGLEALESIAGKFETYLQGGAESYQDAVRSLGQALYDQVLSERAQRRLAETKLEYLRIHVDDEIAQVPWELMHDGEEFLALRFSVGRVVAAKGDVTPRPASSSSMALVVSNPSGDLPGAAEEGTAVAALLRDGFKGEVNHLEGPVGKADFLAALEGCRLLHFAGHAAGDSGESAGLRLRDGILPASQIVAAFGDQAPELVLVNSCHGARSGGWATQARGVSGLASTLLLHGVRHYLGPSGCIEDDDAMFFALRFWEKTLEGAPFGLATRHARSRLLVAQSGPLSFGRYVLYGEPRDSLPTSLTRLQARRTRSTMVDFDPDLVDATLDPAAAAPAPAPAPTTPWWRRRALLLVYGAVLVGSMFWTRKMWFSSEVEAPASAAMPAPTERGTTAPPAAARVQTGPIDIAFLTFKSLDGDDPDGMAGGLSEALITALATEPRFRVVERDQLSDTILAMEDFEIRDWMDADSLPAAKNLTGVEVVVIGAFQHSKTRTRVTARFVEVETGQIIWAAKVDRKRKLDVFDVQDALEPELRKGFEAVVARMRGTGE